MVELIHSDCLTALPNIPDASVDLVFADLPYQTTNCSWDILIPFEPLWAELYRLAKPNAAFVFTACQPFTTRLINSNMKAFRYSMVWDKVNRVTGAVHAKRRPMRAHEDVVIFYRKQPTYNAQMTLGEPYRTVGTRGHGAVIGPDTGGRRVRESVDGSRYPRSILPIKAHTKEILAGHHPTQKPVELLEWIIRTYSNEGDVVLDPTMGSGTTGVACQNLNRDFIGIEMDAGYFETAQKRLGISK